MEFIWNFLRNHEKGGVEYQREEILQTQYQLVQSQKLREKDVKGALVGKKPSKDDISQGNSCRTRTTSLKEIDLSELKTGVI